MTLLLWTAALITSSGPAYDDVLPPQDLAFEARLLLWVMVEHNMRTLSDFIKCNMEDLSSPRVADHQYWVDMLVSAPCPLPPRHGVLTVARAITLILTSHMKAPCHAQS